MLRCLLVRSIKVPAVGKSLTTWASTLNDTAVMVRYVATAHCISLLISYNQISLANTENSNWQAFNVVAICK
jgi:hypothetical protein